MVMRLDQSTYQNEDRDPKRNSKRLMIQLKEIYKFKTRGNEKSHEGSTRGINELNFPSVIKGDLIGCLEIWTSRSPAQGSLGNQGDSIRAGSWGYKTVLFVFFFWRKNQLFWKRFKNFYRIRPVKKVVLGSISHSRETRHLISYKQQYSLLYEKLRLEKVKVEVNFFYDKRNNETMLQRCVKNRRCESPHVTSPLWRIHQTNFFREH